MINVSQKNMFDSNNLYPRSQLLGASSISYHIRLPASRRSDQHTWQQTIHPGTRHLVAQIGRLPSQAALGALWCTLPKTNIAMENLPF